MTVNANMRTHEDFQRAQKRNIRRLELKSIMLLAFVSLMFWSALLRTLL